MFQISPPLFHPARMIHELPLMSLFSSRKLTGRLTCGSNLRAELTVRWEVILLKYPLLLSSLRQCWCICHRMLIGTTFACAHNFKCYVDLSAVEVFLINSFYWGVDFSQNIWETWSPNWVSTGWLLSHDQTKTFLCVRDKGLCFIFERLKSCIAKISW